MSKKPTISEIAQALDISTATVSRALNNQNSKISEATRRKVREMADKLGYEPNIVASSLRKGHSNIVGIIVPYADRHFFASVIRGVEEEVKKHGYHVIISQSYEKLENEKEDIKALLSAQVAGILVSPSSETINDVDHLMSVLDKDKKLIMFDRTIDSIPASSVCIDDYRGAFDLVTSMIKNGCQKLAVFYGNEDVSVFKERLRGFVDAMAMNNLPMPPEFMVKVNNSIEAGSEQVEKLMKLPIPPDGIFSVSDFSALGALQWLKANNYKIPEDVSIAGFGNDPFTSYLTPTMSSVNQRSFEMGVATAQLFLEEMKSGKNEKKKIFLSPEPVLRESTMAKVSKLKIAK